MTKSERIPIPLVWFLKIGARDGWVCHLDGVGPMPDDPWEIDHKKSLRDGGTNHLSNLVLCHRSCNRDKGALSVAS